ncbi:MAG: hypothetical protein QM811_20925 [Pirellulales bacterium]
MAPLRFGTITFRSEQGHIAKGMIRPDGSFDLETYSPGDGAVVGKHTVSVVCSTDQDPGRPASEIGQPGSSLIPAKYLAFETSPLKDFDVKAGRPNVFEIQLND